MSNKEVIGNLGIMPDELKKWNWGAFILGPIWGIANKSYWMLLGLIPYVGCIMPFVGGYQGSEWAWKNRVWKSREQFVEVQRKWVKYGVILIIGLILLGMLIGGIITAQSLIKKKQESKNSQNSSDYHNT